MRHLSFILAMILVALVASPACAQVIPDPAANRQLYIRDKSGKIVDRLQPNGDRYDVYEMRHQFTPMGYAKLFGRRMVIYDLRNNIVATIRAELLPPNSDLSVISIVRDRDGHPIGVLERY